MVMARSLSVSYLGIINGRHNSAIEPKIPRTRDRRGLWFLILCECRAKDYASSLALSSCHDNLDDSSHRLNQAKGNCEYDADNDEPKRPPLLHIAPIMPPLEDVIGLRLFEGLLDGLYPLLPVTVIASVEVWRVTVNKIVVKFAFLDLLGKPAVTARLG